MANPIELILLNRPCEMSRLQDELELLAGQRGYPAKALHDIQLAVEEHLSNVLKYAFQDDQLHEIKVRLDPGDATFVIEVEDDGCPFNPLEYPEPDLSLPMDQRPVGGVGIHLIRKTMDRIEYRRAGGRNYFVMTKAVKAPVP